VSFSFINNTKYHQPSKKFPLCYNRDRLIKIKGHKMVSNTHSDYNENKSIWKANRAAFKGQKSIKEGTTLYLPPKGFHVEQGMKNTTDQGYIEYTAFSNRAVWFDATHRTVEATMGLIFRRPAFITGDDLIEPYVKDFTVDNKTLQTASEELCKEVILQGRAGLLVSYPEVDTTGMSKQEVEDRNIHAYSAIYKTEDIINWKLRKVAGRLIPTLVVLKERVDAPSNTTFDTQKVDQYRVLQLDEEGYYKQTLYYLENYNISEQDPFAKAFPAGEYYPLMNGKKMIEIPFIPIGVSGVTWDIERSPVSGIVDLNIAHYRNSAELEAAIAMTSSPTLVISGFEVKDGSKIVLGGSNALILHDTAGSASFLEYTGAGISSIADAMQEKKKEMAVLGLRILSSEQASNEGSETATIHSKGEESVLENIANSVSEALTRALKLMVEWDNPDADTEEIRVKLNTDFIPNAISANTINALTVLLKSFGISDREMFEVLKRGEILPAEMTFEEHQKQIKESMAFSMFSDLGEDSTTDFNAPVDFRRLTKPEDPGNPQAEKRPDVDPGGSQNR
jgi:hypothetical protein